MVKTEAAAPGLFRKPDRHRGRKDLEALLKQHTDCLLYTSDSYLGTGQIDYVKWDMNRPLTEVNSLVLPKERKGEISHRYVIGLYEILDTVTKRYPEVLFEGCSSGGARFDPGMLAFVAQNWSSDNTDAFDRTQIQSGLSLIYPPVSMGAHVSITPNHQTGRTTSLNTRYQVARLFNLGYELDLNQCSAAEKSEIARQIAEHKAERSWLQHGSFYRNEAPNENYHVWSSVREDGSECLVMIFQKLHQPLCSHGRFPLTGLKPEYDYVETVSGKVYGGDELMESGISVPLVKEDFYAFTFHFVRAE